MTINSIYMQKLRLQAQQSLLNEIDTHLKNYKERVANSQYYFWAMLILSVINLGFLVFAKDIGDVIECVMLSALFVSAAFIHHQCGKSYELSSLSLSASLASGEKTLADIKKNIAALEAEDRQI